MTEYVSPFQHVGHDGPCHSLKFRADDLEDLRATLESSYPSLYEHVIKLGREEAALDIKASDLPDCGFWARIARGSSDD